MLIPNNWCNGFCNSLKHLFPFFLLCMSSFSYLPYYIYHSENLTPLFCYISASVSSIIRRLHSDNVSGSLSSQQIKSLSTPHLFAPRGQPTPLRTNLSIPRMTFKRAFINRDHTHTLSPSNPVSYILGTTSLGSHRKS